MAQAPRPRDPATIEKRSSRVGEMATGRYGEGPEGIDVKKADTEFTEAVQGQPAALQSFMDKAADESL
ncbi:hypothetical protein ACWGIU_37490 [Streptomyces sp. NPDC054840]